MINQHVPNPRVETHTEKASIEVQVLDSICHNPLFIAWSGYSWHVVVSLWTRKVTNLTFLAKLVALETRINIWWSTLMRQPQRCFSIRSINQLVFSQLTTQWMSMNQSISQPTSSVNQATRTSRLNQLSGRSPLWERTLLMQQSCSSSWGSHPQQRMWIGTGQHRWQMSEASLTVEWFHLLLMMVGMTMEPFPYGQSMVYKNEPLFSTIGTNWDHLLICLVERLPRLGLTRWQIQIWVNERTPSKRVFSPNWVWLVWRILGCPLKKSVLSRLSVFGVTDFGVPHFRTHHLDATSSSTQGEL